MIVKSLMNSILNFNEQHLNRPRNRAYLSNALIGNIAAGYCRGNCDLSRSKNVGQVLFTLWARCYSVHKSSEMSRHHFNLQCLR